MTEMVIMRGLPGSGKSTLAKQYADDGYFILSRDGVRAMLTGSPEKQVLQRGLEESITTTLHGMAEDLLQRGYSVVIDEMNLRRKTVKEWVNIAHKHGAEVIDCNTFHVPLETVFTRNSTRMYAVPGELILDLHRRFLYKNEPKLPDPDKPLVV